MRRRQAEAIWINSRNRWQCNVMREGLRKTFTSSTPGRTGKHEAEAKADKWLATFETEQRFLAAIECYLADKELKVQHSTFIAMKAIFDKHIKTAFPPSKKLGSITVYDWQKWLDSKCRDGFAESYIKLLQNHAVALINYCILRKWEVTPINADMLQISACKQKSKAKSALSATEINRLLSANPEQVPNVEFFQLLVLTGLRKGEMLGLRWDDIQDGAIYVRRNVYNDEVHEGKTENAIRKVPITELAGSILNRYKARLLASNSLSVNAVFVNESTGQRFVYGTLNRYWENIRKTLCIGDYSIHELRHTFISITQGDVSEVLLKQVVGHSASMDTYGIYGHQTDKDLTAARNAITKSFDDIIK